MYNRIIVKGIFGVDVLDQNSGFKAFRREAALRMDFNPDGYLGIHRFILPLAHIKGLSIAEIPIVHYERKEGKSYIKFYSVPFICLKDFFKFRKDHKEEIKAARKRAKESSK